jgi:hypothetical protein
MALEGRCMKCKTNREMKDVTIGQTPKGAHMARGKCVECGTNMAKILSKEQAEKLKDAA